MRTYDDGSGAGLIVVGNGPLGDATINGLNRWTDEGWRPLGRGLGYEPWLLLPWDRGFGNELLISGLAPETNLGVIESWNGVQRETLPNSGNRTLLAALTHDAGSGAELYGAFWQFPSGVSRFTGTGWLPVGGAFNGAVLALVEYDAGQGPELYATGQFTQIGALSANRIARWTGSNWTPLVSTQGQGLSWLGTALTTFDSGAGEELIVAGEFASAGGIPARQIAAWDGIQFRPLGAGLDGEVYALEVHDDGSGSALYAAGDFISADGIPVSKIARWNGTAWAPVGSGIPGQGLVSDLQSSQDSSGAPRLIAIGSFTLASGSLADGLAQWDGVTWSPLGAGLQGLGPAPLALKKPSLSLAQASLADLPSSLFVAGAFAESPAGDARLARYGCAGPGTIEALPGCSSGSPSLTCDAPFLKLATQHQFQVSGGLQDGSAILFAGAPGFDRAGCGLILPGIGELLLSLGLLPQSLLAAPNQGGTVQFSLFMPLDPAVLGIPFALQALEVNAQFDQLRLSTGLLAQIRP